MNKRFSVPRIPAENAQTMLISGEYPFLEKALKAQGIAAVKTVSDKRLPKPVRFHPDMQLCVLSKENLFVLKNSEIAEQLKQQGLSTQETSVEPTEKYPSDVLCNAFVLGDYLVCNEKTVDRNILIRADEIGLKVLDVRQGYTSCSAAIVSVDSVITSDAGIAAALKSKGFDVLQIKSGFIKLPGYDTGFFGGCCGMIAPKKLAISGSLTNHPSGDEILRFLNNRDIDTIELCNGDLLDVGGIVPLK